MKKALAVIGATMLASFAFAPAAQAGEIGGSGRYTPVNDHRAASICSFSGLDDVDEEEDPDDPSTDDFGRTQNWGQLSPADRAFLASIGLHPGDSCKPGGR